MTKKYPICHHDIHFFKLKMYQNPFSARLCPGPRWGSLRRCPRPPSRLGRGYLLPIPLPARRLQRLCSQAPLNIKSWLRQCYTSIVFCITVVVLGVIGQYSAMSQQKVECIASLHNIGWFV